MSAVLTTFEGTPVVLAEGERVLRRYEAVHLPGSSGGNGILLVTNARIVFYAKAKGRGTQRESEMIQETRLEDITGVSAYVSYRISLGLLLLTIFFMFWLLVALLAKSRSWIIVDAVVVAVLLATLLGSGSRRGGAGVSIRSASSESSPINFGSFAAQRGGFLRLLLFPWLLLFHSYTAFDVAFGMPGQDSSKIVAELGALILDMQQRGEEAYARWDIAGPGVLPPDEPPPMLLPERGNPGD